MKKVLLEFIEWLFFGYVLFGIFTCLYLLIFL